MTTEVQAVMNLFLMQLQTTITRHGLVRSLALAMCLVTSAGWAQTSGSAMGKGNDEWFHRFEEHRQGPEQTERFTKTIKLGRQGSLDLANITGDIVVSPSTGDDLTIDAVKRVRSRDDNAKQWLDELIIDVLERPGRVEVRTTYPHRRGPDGFSVDYTVRVPIDAAVSLRSVSGDIRVSGIKGEVRAETVSGDARALDVTELVQAKSVSGDVEVANASSESQLIASTVSGSLMARSIKARGLEIETVSGDLRLENVTCERARVHSVSGNLDYSGPLARNGRYDMNSHSGDVRLAVGSDIGFELDASTFSGTIRSDLPLTYQGQRSSTRDDERREGRDSRSIRATFGDGSASLELRTFSGDIVIAKR